MRGNPRLPDKIKSAFDALIYQTKSALEEERIRFYTQCEITENPDYKVIPCIYLPEEAIRAILKAANLWDFQVDRIVEQLSDVKVFEETVVGFEIVPTTDGGPQATNFVARVKRTNQAIAADILSAIRDGFWSKTKAERVTNIFRDLGLLNAIESEYNPDSPSAAYDCRFVTVSAPSSAEALVKSLPAAPVTTAEPVAAEDHVGDLPAVPVVAEESSVVSIYLLGENSGHGRTLTKVTGQPAHYEVFTHGDPLVEIMQTPIPDRCQRIDLIERNQEKHDYAYPPVSDTAFDIRDETGTVTIALSKGKCVRWGDLRRVTPFVPGTRIAEVTAYDEGGGMGNPRVGQERGLSDDPYAAGSTALLVDGVHQIGGRGLGSASSDGF
jgi:hypothetical protein